MSIVAYQLFHLGDSMSGRQGFLFMCWLSQLGGDDTHLREAMDAKYPIPPSNKGLFSPRSLL